MTMEFSEWKINTAVHLLGRSALVIDGLRRTIGSLFVVVWLSCFAACATGEDSIPNAISNIQPSIVKVSSQFDELPADTTAAVANFFEKKISLGMV